MQYHDFRCFHRLRVRWAEVDRQNIAFNAHYLAWADCAMTEYWRALALPYDSSMQMLGGELYLRKASVEYHASAHMDDRLDIGMRCARLGTTSLGFDCAVFTAGRLLAGIELVYVFADPATQTKRPLPVPLRALLEGYEAGEDMVQLRTGDWATLGADAAALRRAVFVQEQGIDEALELDEHDVTALHAVAYNRLGVAIATGRLLAPTLAPTGEREGSMGRMAVERSVRGTRWGRMVLDALEQAACLRGDTQLILHAQCSAENFYRRAGFTAQGAPYEEAGLAHITMGKLLKQE